MEGIWFNLVWNFRLEPFSDWDGSRWFVELLNHLNSFPLDDEQKRELCNFAMFLEIVWMMRNKIFHDENIPDWWDIGVLIYRQVSKYWETNKRNFMAVKVDKDPEWVSPLLVGSR